MVIQTENLTKQYGKKRGCENINISVEEGSLYGFLGPNGAGKSTCIKMLTGLIFPTSGTATVLGEPIGSKKARSKMGYLPEQFRYQNWMTGYDLLDFHSRLYGMFPSSERNEGVLKRVGLDGQGKFRVGSYSKGMQQRIGLACALLPDPDLLLLDEPTSALDPVGRKEVRDIMLSLYKEGKTIFLNSHLLTEVEAVCETVTIIHKGSVARTSTMRDLLEESVSLCIRAEGIGNELMERIKARFDASPVQTAEGLLSLKLKDTSDVPAVAAMLIDGGAELYELSPKRETLENVFLRIVGEEVAV